MSKPSEKKRLKQLARQRAVRAKVNRMNQQRANSADQEEGHKDRLHLLQHNEFSVQKMIEHAVGEGRDLRSLVFFLIDMRDSQGGSLCRALGVTDRDVQTWSRGGKEIPTAMVTMKRSEAALMMRDSNPNSSRMLSAIDPTPGNVWVACVASEGVMLAQHPITTVASASA